LISNYFLQKYLKDIFPLWNTQPEMA
jgi:hypothetical protein